MTVSRQSLVTNLDITVKSGVDLIESAKGSASLWFSRTTGRTQLSVTSSTNSATVVAIRQGDEFYEAPTQAQLADHKVDLTKISQQNPGAMPEIQAAGLDPFQLLTLFSAVRWSDSTYSERPTVTADAAGQRAEYEIVLDLQHLSRHASSADSGWLITMAHASSGTPVTITVLLGQDGIDTLTTDLPVPAAPATARASATSSTGAAPPATSRLRVTVAQTFDYHASAGPIITP